MNRAAAKTFAKVLPIIHHYVCMDFGISKRPYGSETETLGGTRQGNSVSRVICRDTLYLIFKYLKEKKLGVMLRHPISSVIIQ